MEVRSPFGCFKVEESSILGPEIIHEALDKVRVIRDRSDTAYSWKKSYADNGKRNLEFDIDDQVYLNTSPLKGMMRFGWKGKLSPRFVGRYEVLKRVGRWLMSWHFHGASFFSSSLSCVHVEKVPV